MVAERLPSLSRRELLTSGAAAMALATFGGAVVGCNRADGAKSAADLPIGTSSSSPVPPVAKLTDIEHVVIHMQENRSFDHYFGTRAGARGFADPAVAKGSDGRPVWYQPDPSRPEGYLLPFHLETQGSRGACVPDPDHSWEAQHAAWNGGKQDGFARTMGQWSLGYYERDDLPWYNALADQFTLCDRWFCSVLGPTGPNRLYLMSGTIDPGGTRGGPATGGDAVYSWETYPERLQQAGISWRIYHEADDYDDNVVKYFANYRAAKPGDPLYDEALVDRDADAFARDAASGNLPQVSWIVSPTTPSEHPAWPPAYGEAYTAKQLGAVMSNPKLWAKTVFIVCYDENGGFFDHVVPPVPPPKTADEYVGDQPIGLGFRVPALVVSPWSRGGKVVGDVFDHTSVLRFLEARFGVEVPNLSRWRREAVGDLTSTLDFRSVDTSMPSLPDTAARVEEMRVACGQGAEVTVPSPQQQPTIGR